MLKRVSNNKGATLIEVMGTVLLFMVGISALLSVFFASTKMSTRAREAYAAYNIARGHIEDLKAYSFSDLAVATEVKSVVDQNGVDDPNNGLYVRSTTPQTSYNGDSNLTQITVQVWYFLNTTDVQSFLSGTLTNPASVQMSTVIYQNG